MPWGNALVDLALSRISLRSVMDGWAVLWAVSGCMVIGYRVDRFLCLQWAVDRPSWYPRDGATWAGVALGDGRGFARDFETKKARCRRPALWQVAGLGQRQSVNYSWRLLFTLNCQRQFEVVHAAFAVPPPFGGALVPRA